jgi:hypothetical protein
MRSIVLLIASRANPAVQGTLRDKTSRSVPDLECWAFIGFDAQPSEAMSPSLF